MDFGMFLLGTAVAGVLLFLWAGLTQALTPWGIRAVKEVPEDQTAELTEAITQTTPPGGVYGVFNARVATFVAVKPGRYYDMRRYFALEFLTQVVVGALLTGILILTAPLDAGAQLLLVGLIGLLAEVAIDFQYWNWWGFSTPYAFGFAVNRIVGYLVIGFILINFVL